MDDFDTALRLNLFNVPGSVSVKRRGASTAWLETASVCKNGSDITIKARFCCSWSPLHVEVLVDGATGLVYCEDGNGQSTLPKVLEELNATLASKSSTYKLPSVLAALTKNIERNAHIIWPSSGPQAWTSSTKTPLAIAVRDAVHSLSRHPVLTGASTDDSRLTAVLDGLSFMTGLVTSAFHNVRRPVICKPVPHWLLHGSDVPLGQHTEGERLGSPVHNRIGVSAGSNAGKSSPMASAEEVSSPHAQVMDFNTQLLMEALRGMPELAGLGTTGGQGGRGDGATLLDEQRLATLPVHTLLLLYWLTCLCPVHLLRLPRPTGTASMSFHVLHGPGQEQGNMQPLWDVQQAARYGTFGVPWWHGTSYDNGLSALCYGLRSLSGTRHSTSGAIFGEGVYATNDIRVALQFAKKTGVTWFGSPTGSGQGSGSGSGHTRGPVHPSPGGGAPSNDGRAGSAQGGQQAEYTRLAQYRLVLELDIVAAPTTALIVDGKDVTATSRIPVPPPQAATGQPQAGGRAQRYNVPPSCYAVVRDDTCLWIQRLHVFEDAAEGPGSASEAVARRPAAQAQAPVRWFIPAVLLPLLGVLLALAISRWLR